MSGHSKWSKVKHQKATTDLARGAAFTKASRAITVAVAEGGGITDPDMNFRLRLAVEKAREVNMPKDTIERAIAKGKGDTGSSLEQIIYEGYGPGGVAILVDATTDNHQRTGSAIKHLFDRAGGNLAAPGSVNFLFDRAVVIITAKNNQSLDSMLEIALMAGADDVIERDDSFEIYVMGGAFPSLVKKKLEDRGLTVLNTEFIMRPKISISVSAETGQKLDELINQLEDLEDVQRVYTNAE